ncbi:Protein-export protein SecB [Trichinella pseudospiralis]
MGALCSVRMDVDFFYIMLNMHPSADGCFVQRSQGCAFLLYDAEYGFIIVTTVTCVASVSVLPSEILLPMLSILFLFDSCALLQFPCFHQRICEYVINIHFPASTVSPSTSNNNNTNTRSYSALVKLSV